MDKHVTIRVTGSVQGVYFRKSTKEFADGIGLVGYVKNNMDGTVTAEACGTDEQLEKIISWCKSGPNKAHVDKIEYNITSKCNKHYKIFEFL